MHIRECGCESNIVLSKFKFNCDEIHVGGYKGGVLLPNGRVVLVPAFADMIGLYDPNESLPPAYTLSRPLPLSWNALLLPYYNKF